MSVSRIGDVGDMIDNIQNQGFWCHGSFSDVDVLDYIYHWSDLVVSVDRTDGIGDSNWWYQWFDLLMSAIGVREIDY